MLRILVCILMLALAACGGGSGSSTQPPISSTITIELQWDPPTEYEDGTPFTPLDLKQYKVYYGEDPNFLKETGKTLIILGGQTNAVITVPKGIWYAAVTTIDVDDLESNLSNIVTYTN